MVKTKRRVLLSFGTKPTTYEKKKIQNKEYLAFRCVAIKTGVLNGIYVTNECIDDAAKFAEGLSAVVVHPLNGNHPNSIEEKEKRQVGYFQNVTVTESTEKDDQGKPVIFKSLEGDVYIDPDMAEYVGFTNDLEKLKQGVAFNVSLGGFMEWQMEPGIHRGKNYKVIGVSFVTDHIAILPNEEGACSVKDGCYIGSLDPPCQCPDKKKCGCSPGKVAFSENIVSSPGYSKTMTMFRYLIEDLLGDDVYFHIFDVYPGFGIFETKGKYYAVKYIRDIDEQMKISSEPIALIHRDVFEVDQGGMIPEIGGNSEQDEWLRQAGGIQKGNPNTTVTLLSKNVISNNGDKTKEDKRDMEISKVEFTAAMKDIADKITDLGSEVSKISAHQKEQEEKARQVLFAKVLSNPNNTLSEATIRGMDASTLQSLSDDLDKLSSKNKKSKSRSVFTLVNNKKGDEDEDDFIPDEEVN